MTARESRARGRPKSVDRARAIAAAMHSYWEVGMSALSLNEVCRRAGLSKPALYREFGSEDGLHAAALNHYRELVSEPLLSPLRLDAPFKAGLEAAVVGLTAARDTPAGCLFTMMRLAVARLGPQSAADVRELELAHREAYEAWFRRGLAAGEANPDIKPELAARYLDTQVATILVQMGLGIEPGLIRAQARIALRALLRMDAGHTL